MKPRKIKSKNGKIEDDVKLAILKALTNCGGDLSNENGIMELNSELRKIGCTTEVKSLPAEIELKEMKFVIEENGMLRKIEN